MKMTITEFCRKHIACEEGENWAVENCKDMDEVWEKAKPEWLIWVATRNGVLTDKERRLLVVWSARQVQHLMRDDRSIAGIDVAERYANGNATDEELKAVREMVREAVRDAWLAAKDAPNYAKKAIWAAREVVLGATSGLAWGAGWVAARPLAYEADSDADSAAAMIESWGAQADYLRQNCKPNFER